MMKYKALIFDLDGTLLDTLEDLKNSVNYALREKGCPERTSDEVRSFVGNGIYMLVKRALPENTEESIINEAFLLFKEHYGAFLNENTREYPGITDLLKALRDKKIKTAVVTNKADEAARSLVNSFFGDLIDYTAGQRQGKPTKPDPAMLNEALDVLGVTAEEAIFIGDSDVDVKTAHNGNLPCIGVTWGFRSEDVLTKAGADFIVHSTDEIIRLL